MSITQSAKQIIKRTSAQFIKLFSRKIKYARDSLGSDADKSTIDLLLNHRDTIVSNFRGNGILLFVNIIINLRISNIITKKAGDLL